MRRRHRSPRQPRRLLTVLAAVFLVVATACGAPADSATAQSEPPPEPGPVELIGHWTTATHAGDCGVATHPRNGSAEASAFCIADRGGRARDRGTCVVEDAPFAWHDQVYPWTVRASWTGLEGRDAATVGRLPIHGFDDQDRRVAYWAGGMDEHTGHVTE